jgi:hypothetical protein
VQEGEQAEPDARCYWIAALAYVRAPHGLPAGPIFGVRRSRRCRLLACAGLSLPGGAVLRAVVFPSPAGRERHPSPLAEHYPQASRARASFACRTSSGVVRRADPGRLTVRAYLPGGRGHTAPPRLLLLPAVVGAASRA